MLVFAVSALTLIPCILATSRVWTPIDPVEPRTDIFFVIKYRLPKDAEHPKGTCFTAPVRFIVYYQHADTELYAQSNFHREQGSSVTLAAACRARAVNFFVKLPLMLRP